MGTEETKDTVPSRDKQTPAYASVTTSKTTTTTTSDLKIEGEEENIIIVPKNQQFDELDKALDHNYSSAVLDSSKIKELGPMVKDIAEAFEDTMTMIEKVPYEEQIILFKGYKKLVEEQIKIVDSRIDMTERLK
jgi:hypothetical protein